MAAPIFWNDNLVHGDGTQSPMKPGNSGCSFLTSEIYYQPFRLNLTSRNVGRYGMMHIVFV